MKKAIKLALASLAITAMNLVPQTARAATFYEGMRGPTNNQVEVDFNTAESEGTKHDYTTKLKLKGWYGDNSGWWWLVSAPYKSKSTEENGKQQGIGDITLLAGPRGILEKSQIHWMAYAGVTLPTGDTGYQRPEKDFSVEGLLKGLAEAQDRPSRLKLLLDYGSKAAAYENLPENKPALGSGRTNVHFGIGATKLFGDNGEWDVNASIDYTLTCADKDSNSPDVFSAGVFVGRELFHPQYRAGVGLNHWTDSEGNNGSSLTGGLRWATKDSSFIVRLMGEQDLNNSDSKSLELQLKYNF